MNHTITIQRGGSYVRVVVGDLSQLDPKQMADVINQIRDKWSEQFSQTMLRKQRLRLVK